MVRRLTITVAVPIGAADGAGAGTGIGNARASWRLASARDAIDEIFQISDAGPVTVKPVLVRRDCLLERCAPCRIASQSRRRRNISVNVRRDGFGDAHHLEDRRAVTAA